MFLQEGFKLQWQTESVSTALSPLTSIRTLSLSQGGNRWSPLSYRGNGAAENRRGGNIILQNHMVPNPLSLFFFEHILIDSTQVTGRTCAYRAQSLGVSGTHVKWATEQD
jgi:hypothetical protein